MSSVRPLNSPSCRGPALLPHNRRANTAFSLPDGAFSTCTCPSLGLVFPPASHGSTAGLPTFLCTCCAFCLEPDPCPSALPVSTYPQRFLYIHRKDRKGTLAACCNSFWGPLDCAGLESGLAFMFTSLGSTLSLSVLIWNFV